MSRTKNSQRGLILMMSLWILALISLASIGLGHRVVTHLKLLKFRRDDAQVTQIARAGVRAAASILVQDETIDTDTMNEVWYCGFNEDIADGEPIFKDVMLGAGSFRIQQTFLGEPGQEDPVTSQTIYYGLTCEDSKININSANPETLEALFGTVDSGQAPELAEAVTFWRGDDPEGRDPYYETPDIPYAPRMDLLKTIDELSLVKGFREDAALRSECEKLCTVIGEGDINVNLACEPVLYAVFVGLGANTINESFAQRLTDNILAYRSGIDGIEATDDDGVITESNFVSEEVLKRGIVAEPELNWIDAQKQNFPFTYASRFFRIEVEASLKTGGLRKQVVAILNRSETGRIVYWREE